jgi:hypothetical protein
MQRAGVSASSESDRNFYTEREQAWLKLANSYELSERVTRVTNELQRRSRLMSKPPTRQRGTNLLVMRCRNEVRTIDSRQQHTRGSDHGTPDVALFTCPNCGRVRNQLLINRDIRMPGHR